MSDGLDALSNKELLVRCRQYGLPVIPVTDSTRNVITRRLRAAMLGTPLNKSQTQKNANSATAKKSAPRRETLHAEKVSNNTRERQNQNRRTIAYGLDNVSLSGRSVQTTTTVSDVGSQSEDDDYYMVQVPDVGYSKPTQTPPNREDERRLRRSVSLTKSGVLTTSYTREVDAPRFDESDEVNEPTSFTYERPRVTHAPVHSPPTSYEPDFRRTFATDLNQSRPHLTQTQLNSTSYLDADYNQYSTPKTYESPLRTTTIPTPRSPFSSQPESSQPRQRQPVSESSPSWPAGRLIHPTTKVDTLYPKLDNLYDRQHRQTSYSTGSHRPMDLDTDSETDEPKLTSSSRLSSNTRPQMRRPLVRQNPQNGPMQQFGELVRTLDRQYHLRYYLLLTVLVMVATMIYVVVTPS
ncbi:LEM domain-containing protein Bocksbeutel-like [Drosophila tropicalis]|uniref:LEM domain-containing protein Bocksbeutel-like n=1 Tax=Drosophila tropicalis TaxID=46794 RepID=UPI0035ABC772